MTKYYSTWKRKFTDSQGQEQEKYYACSRKGSIVDNNELAELISQSSSLAYGDVLSCLKSLSIYMRMELEQGKTVSLKDIGSFSLALSSNGYDSAKEITADKVKATKIVFRANDKLRSLLSNEHFTSWDKKISKIKGLKTK